jgi:flagellar biosynthesis GTPase FlhF
LAQLETRLDKWLFAIRNLSRLDTAPAPLAEEVFRRFFEAAEIAQLDPEERDAYEQSLKYYRDLNNVVATAREEGAQEIAQRMKVQVAEAQARAEEERRQKEVAQTQAQEERRQKEEERRQKDEALAELARLKQRLFEEGK